VCDYLSVFSTEHNYHHCRHRERIRPVEGEKEEAKKENNIED